MTKYRSIRFGNLVSPLALICAISGGAVALPASAWAQAEEQRDFSIAAGDLATALQQFSAQTGVQLVYSSDLVAGKRTGGVNGRLSRADALAAVLAGTGLTARLNGNSATITPIGDAVAGDGERVLGAVRIEGANGQGLAGATSVNGINGSRDVTATEGTRSYTSNALTIGSKMAESIKDVPMSVSVLTRQQMTDQNVTDFRTAMERLPGVISNLSSATNNQPSFYSRGFEITTVQIDGGAGLTYKSQYGNRQYYQPIMDMSLYDHVEIVRGAEGTFTGYGNPGGVVNLVRKKPLDHVQLLVEGQLGSFNMHRASVDLTGPIGFNGALRGRVIATHQDNDFFYDVVHNNQNVIAGTLELDVTPTTLLSVGATHTDQKSGLWNGGLMRRVDGTTPDYPRSTCLCLPWAHTKTNNNEVFGQIEQKISSAWNLKFKTTYQRQTADNIYAYVIGAITPDVDPLGPQGTTGLLVINPRSDRTRSLLSELTIDGSFNLFGRKQKIIVGANYSRMRPNGSGEGYANQFPTGNNNVYRVDPTNFDPYNPAYAYPGVAGPLTEILDDTFSNTTMFLRFNLEPLARLHLIAGINYTRFVYKKNELLYCIPVFVAYNIFGCTDNFAPIPRTDEFGQHTRLSGSDVSWPPRASLSYDLRHDLSVYATYSDIYIDQSSLLTKDRNPLLPVKGMNLEGGAKWAPRDGRLNVTFSGYYINQKNFAQSFCHTQQQEDAPNWVDDGSGICTDRPTGGTTTNLVSTETCCYIQDPNQKNISYGVDFEVSGEVARNWQVAASYTFNRNFFSPRRSDGLSRKAPLLTFSPPHLFKVWTSYRFNDGSMLQGLTLNAGAQGQTATRVVDGYCQNPRDTDGDGNIDCDYENDYKTAYFSDPGHIVVSLGGIYEFNKNLSLQLNIENLLDKKYFATISGLRGGNWYGAPRNVAVTLRGKF
jgi:outer-membrane receptor for ferric coprogen and ferric-rhodotorulic acid